MLRSLQKVARSTKMLSWRPAYRSGYAAEMYKAWQADPKSVSEQWANYFKNNKPVAQPTETQSAESDLDSPIVMEAFKLLRYYGLRGHEMASIDPLCTPKLDFRTAKPELVWQDLPS